MTFKSIAEQRLEWLMAERSRRQLTNEEWQAVARSEHAIYCRNRRRMAAA